MMRVFALTLLLAAYPGFAQQKTGKRAKQAPKTEAAPTRWPIATLEVEGLHNYSKEQVLAVAGLKMGQMAGKDDFEAARGRLEASGAFETVGYKFAPGAGGSGYNASFQVTEAGPMYEVRFEGLGVADPDVKKWMEAREPLFGAKIPATTVMIERYAHSIEELLASKERKEKVIGKLAPDVLGSFFITFRPATAIPAVAEVRLAGNSAVTTRDLLESFSGVAYGTPYTETGFRQLLDTSVRPLYEAKGYLRVAFPKVTAESSPAVKGVIVNVTVEEGPVYKLTKVKLAPNPITDGGQEALLKAAKFKLDQPADFDDISAGVTRMRKMVQRRGYMRVESVVERTIDDRTKTVDLTVSIHEGPQFTFGKLDIVGLDLHGEAAIKKLWGLKPGQPFDADYPDYFMNRVKEDGLFDNLRNTQAVPKIDEANHVVDVTLRFK